MMQWTRMFERLKRTRPSGQSGENDREIDNALETRNHQLQAVDPSTDAQWRRLRTSLSAREISPATPGKIFGITALRPALAFGVVLAVFVAIGMWLLEPTVKTYETIQGQQATIILPDSTEVVLNHTSQLIVRHSFLERERRVVLKGEAYFRVQHNGKPFIVSTDVGSVRVLGTEFNVYDRNGQMDVGVVHGSVRVTCASNSRDSSIVLSADHMIACTTTGFTNKPTHLPFPDFPAWMHGKIVLYRTDLLAACRELESQFGITITIQNQRMKNVTITGTLDGNNVDTALATLASLTGMSVHHEGSGYILY